MPFHAVRAHAGQAFRIAEALDTSRPAAEQAVQVGADPVPRALPHLVAGGAFGKQALAVLDRSGLGGIGGGDTEKKRRNDARRQGLRRYPHPPVARR